MINKVIWWLVIVLAFYLLAIFNVPIFADKIWDLLWVHDLNNNIRETKKSFDKAVTTVPSKEELQKWYEKAYSGAIEIKENFNNWLDLTKDKINSFRKTMSWAEEKYEQTKEFIEDTSEKIDKIKEVIDVVSSTWSEQ